MMSNWKHGAQGKNQDTIVERHICRTLYLVQFLSLAIAAVITSSCEIRNSQKEANLSASNQFTTTEYPFSVPPHISDAQQDESYVLNVTESDIANCKQIESIPNDLTITQEECDQIFAVSNGASFTDINNWDWSNIEAVSNPDRPGNCPPKPAVTDALTNFARVCAVPMFGRRDALKHYVGCPWYSFLYLKEGWTAEVNNTYVTCLARNGIQNACGRKIMAVWDSDTLPWIRKTQVTADRNWPKSAQAKMDKDDPVPYASFELCQLIRLGCKIEIGDHAGWATLDCSEVQPITTPNP
jgi:hypothetical protein